jgi:MoxR-like ATPase
MIDAGLVAQAVAAYDPAAHEASILMAEEQRAEVLALFPADGWTSMTLERYALGQPDRPDNFCRWMEFVTVELGSIKGGNARKHLIYFQAKAGEWWFDTKLFSSVEEAWDAVRQGFVDAIELARQGAWDDIAKIKALASGPALVTKALSIYFPDELLPINSQTHLRHFLRELGESRADDPGMSTQSLNRLLLEGLRASGEVDGWTTKAMERLLYSAEFNPFGNQAPGPIPDAAAFIRASLEEAGDNRLEARRETEDQARKLLAEKAGGMTEDEGRSLLTLFNLDFDNGKQTVTRFSPAFVGQTANGLLANLDSLNHWTERLWRADPDEADAALTELLANRKLLPSAGTSYPTMLAYLRAPEARAVWLRITDRGLQRLCDYKPVKHPGNGRFEDYAAFCAAAQNLMDDYQIPPELLDYVLAGAGRAEDEPIADNGKKAASVWLFQANPSIYDIDLALTEVNELEFTVRQKADDVHEQDRVYLWRAGKDAGVVATATVLSEPVESVGNADDPYVVKPDQLAAPAPRVKVRVDRVLSRVLSREALLEHSILKDLGVLRFAHSTNYAVTAEQDAALRTLLEEIRLPPLGADIEDRLHLPRAWLDEARTLLSEKGQVVFYGPPGTGKTYVALAIAEDITRDGGDYRIVQFHPSYSYEDFVGGFRPVEDDGSHGVRYQRMDGPLRELAAAATSDPGNPYLLVIDEINRGNIPKIFGELLFLLEYRQKSATLQYWPEKPFRLPPNLFVIGTMNTADRSIALVDAALRRRFYFFGFLPTVSPVSEVLDKWLTRYGLDEEPARLLELLNEQIKGDEFAIGPSYFMTDPVNGPDLERVWERAIMPLLEEHHYGMTWDREACNLPSLRKRLAVPVADNAETVKVVETHAEDGEADSGAPP